MIQTTSPYTYPTLTEHGRRVARALCETERIRLEHEQGRPLTQDEWTRLACLCARVVGTFPEYRAEEG